MIVLTVVGAIASVATLSVAASPAQGAEDKPLTRSAVVAKARVAAKAAGVLPLCQVQPSSSALMRDLAMVSGRRCIHGNRDSAKKVLFVADSHGRSWLPAFDRIAKRNDWAVHTRMRSACWYASIARFRQQPVPKLFHLCPEWNQVVRRGVQRKKFDAVILVRSQEHFSFNTSPAPAVRSRQLRAQLVDTFRFYSRITKKIVIVQDRVIGHVNVPKCLLQNRGRTAQCAPRRSTGYRFEGPLAAAERNAARAAGVTARVAHVRTDDMFCARGARLCPIFGLGGQILFLDRTHLPLPVAHAVVPILGPRVNRALGIPWPQVAP